MTAGRDVRAVVAAACYDAPKDLWVVSAYFDSEGYATKLRALKAYIRVMERSGIPLLLVEGAFGRRRFVLPESDRVLHVRCPSVMWQKECLLNLAIEHLPASCRKVAWLDTDIFFQNPRWAVETAGVLELFPVVQPFDVALWLPKGATQFRGRGLAWSSFAAVAYCHPGLFLSGDFDRHGHSGYAWAARRDLIQKHRLYDLSVAGSGDHLMAHAMMGDLSSPCVTNSVGAAGPFRDSFHAWAKPFHSDVRSRVGLVRGAILHRWHGDRKKRQYYKRMVGLLARGYNPLRDVRVAASGALEWTEHGATLGRWMKDYFTRRQEDGRPGPVGKVPWPCLVTLTRGSPTRLDEAMRPFAPLLGPLATLVAEQSEEWTRTGLTPVLANLIAALILGRTIPDGAGKATASVRWQSYCDPKRLIRVGRVGAGIEEEVDGFEIAEWILGDVLRAAKRLEKMASHQWKWMTPERRWAFLSGASEGRYLPLSEDLRARVRDPRWSDAPELKTATRQLRDARSRLARRGRPSHDPFDAVVGPGSSAAGLDHV